MMKIGKRHTSKEKKKGNYKMANEKIKTCEEYVLNILAKKEEELKVLETKATELASKLDLCNESLQKIIGLVKEMAQHLYIKQGTESNYECMYSDENFIGLLNRDLRADLQDQFVVSLIRLAECVGIDLYTPVEREKE